jgi:hypothetical protein
MAEKEGLQAQLRAMMEDTRHTLAELDAKERSVAEREAAFAHLQQQYDATRTVQEQLKTSVNIAERAMKERMEEAVSSNLPAAGGGSTCHFSARSAGFCDHWQYLASHLSAAVDTQEARWN